MVVVDLHCNPKMAAPEISSRSPKLSDRRSTLPTPPVSPRVQDSSAIVAYEQYLRLPELSNLWNSIDFPQWRNESILKPALQSLEITFRLISIALSDPRPYANQRQWKRRLESLATRQIEIIATVCEEDESIVAAPIVDLTSANGLLARRKSSQEVWKIPGTTAVVTHTSEASLLPRLATWEKAEEVASKIQFQIECQMQRCPYTLGLGEPNLAGKPSLHYDLVVRPTDLHSLKKIPLENLNNHENQTLFTIHHIFESWLCTARRILRRIGERIDGEEWQKAASDCWLLERIWKLLSEVEDLHLLMDPDDFLRLKSQLAIRATSGSEAFCFRSAALLDVTSLSKDLKRKVPRILGAEVDPNGGPRLQEAAMRLFHSRRRGEGGNCDRIQLLQGFQAVEAAVKRFFFAYRQLIAAVMGSLEATGNRGVGFSVESRDSLSQEFMEPPYFPSLDGAKTFLGELWQREHRTSNGFC